MIEQGPIRWQDGLTNKANSPKLERGGVIFMSTQPGGGGPEIHLGQAGQEATALLENIAHPDILPQLEAAYKAKVAADWREHLQGITDPHERETSKAMAEYFTERGMPPPWKSERETLTEQQAARARVESEEAMERDPVVIEQAKTLKGILSDERVRAELREKHPNFNSEALKNVRDYFDQMDVSRGSGAELRNAAYIIVRSEGISEASRQLLFEWTYEKLVGKPDLGSEESQYKIGSFQLLTALDDLDGIASAEFGEKVGGEGESFGTYLRELAHVREVAHELNRNLNYGDQYKEYVLSHLGGAGLDFMQNQLAGVGTVVRMFEKSSAAKVAETHTQLTDGDLTAIEREVRGSIETLSARGTLTEESRVLTDWERERALRIGKILFAGTQRQAMYTGLGDINPSFGSSSLHSEWIVRALYDFKTVSPRFFSRNPGPARLMDITWEEMSKANEAGGNPYVSLFGAKTETMMQNSCGAKDPESHAAWRASLLFLGNIDMGDQTLLEYLTHLNNVEMDKDPNDDPWGHSKKAEAFSAKVKDDVLGQRLYLSVLARYGDFDGALKQKVWEKIALLKPSTIASLLPETTYTSRQTALIEKQKMGKLSQDEKRELKQLTEASFTLWDGLKKKLFIAEEERVEHDAKQQNELKGDKEGLKLAREAEVRGFSEAVAIARSGGAWTPEQFRTVLKYMGMEKLITEDGGIGLTSDEQRLLQVIISKGINNSSKLAKAQTNFTYVIDDAPKIAWKKTGEGQAGVAREDLIRIFINDQDNYAKGWTEINGIMEYPTKDVIKHFAEAVEKIGNVDGRTAAQNQIEPFIRAWLRMAETRGKDLWIPGAMTAKQILRKPTSIMEEYYRNEFTSFTEEEKGNFLAALSQAKAIRDSLAEGDMVGVNRNMTQLDRLRKDTKSDRMSLLIAQIRLMVMIFGPAFGMEFMNAIMPKDLQG